jgi:protein BCP1
MAKRRRLPEDEGKQRAKNEREDDSLDEDEEDATTSSDDDGSSSAPEVSTDDGGGGSDSDGDGGSSGELDEVNVNFEFFDPLEGDFHGLKALLGAYLDGEVYDISGLADAIIAQVCFVGLSVVVFMHDLKLVGRKREGGLVADVWRVLCRR